MSYEGDLVTVGKYCRHIKEAGHSPCSAGHQIHSGEVCSRTAAVPRAPANRQRAGPAAGRQRLLTGGSASAGRNLWGGSSGTLTRRRGIATSSSANRAERTSNRKWRETASSVDGGPAPAEWRGLNHARSRSIPGPLMSGVMGAINRLRASWWLSYDNQGQCAKNALEIKKITSLTWISVKKSRWWGRSFCFLVIKCLKK